MLFGIFPFTPTSDISYKCCYDQLMTYNYFIFPALLSSPPLLKVRLLMLCWLRSKEHPYLFLRSLFFSDIVFFFFFCLERDLSFDCFINLKHVTGLQSPNLNGKFTWLYVKCLYPMIYNKGCSLLFICKAKPLFSPNCIAMPLISIS